MSKFKFSVSERLKSKKRIDFLFRQGKSAGSYPIKLVYLSKPIAENEQPLQAGFTVSKRYFKKAVDRNRIKRLMRECFRLQKNSLREYLEQKKLQLEIFLIFTGKELPEYQLIEKHYKIAIEKLWNQLDEESAQHT